MTQAVLRVLALFALSVCVSQTPDKSTLSSAEEDTIREAVLRFQIRNYDKSVRIYFVRINSGDPSSSFLARFSDSEKTIRKKSEARIDVNGLVVDKKTGARGVILGQDEIRRTSDHAVQVQGNYVCGSLCGASGTYYLQYEGQHWLVVFRASKIY